MKTIIPILAALILVGCGNKNSTDQSSATNSAANYSNSPAGEMTNAPAITNGAATNSPAMTNR